jgi:hypothetical protein
MSTQSRMRFATVGDVTVAVPADLDLTAAEIERAPEEADAEFEAAKTAYAVLFEALA